MYKCALYILILHDDVRLFQLILHAFICTLGCSAPTNTGKQRLIRNQDVKDDGNNSASRPVVVEWLQ